METEKVAEEKLNNDSVGLFLRAMVDREPGKRKVKPSKVALLDLATLDLGESSDDSDFNVDEAKLKEDDDISINSDLETNQHRKANNSDSNSSDEESQDTSVQNVDDLTIEELIARAESKKIELERYDRPKILVCAICLAENSDDLNEIVTCDMCHISVHEGCYGISDTLSVSSTVSSCSTEPWFCDACKAGVEDPSCELCPNLGYTIFKETEMGRWVHLVCALYVPGVAFTEVEKLSFPTLFETHYSRYGSKVCTLCEDERYSRTGMCIGCDAGMCRSYFHVTCAQREGLLSEVNHYEADQADPYYAHCKLHTDKDVMRRRRRNWLALQLHMRQGNKEKLSESESTQNRLQRKLVKYTEKYNFAKANKPPPWFPTQKMSRSLSTSATFFRSLLHKTKLMGMESAAPQADAQMVLSDVRKKWHISPAFNVEFIGYFIDRIDRVQEMKNKFADLLKENENLTKLDHELSNRYTTLKKQHEDMEIENNELLNKSLEIHDMLKGLAGRPLKLPAALAALCNPPVEGAATPSEGRNRTERPMITKAATKMMSGVDPFSIQGPAVQKSSSEIRVHTCDTCNRTEDQHLLIQCDTCQHFYHLACLDPPLGRMPKKTKQMGWQCSDCCKSSDSDKGTDLDLSGPRKLRRTPKDVLKYSPSHPGSCKSVTPLKLTARSPTMAATSVQTEQKKRVKRRLSNEFGGKRKRKKARGFALSKQRKGKKLVDFPSVNKEMPSGDVLEGKKGSVSSTVVKSVTPDGKSDVSVSKLDVSVGKSGVSCGKSNVCPEPDLFVSKSRNNAPKSKTLKSANNPNAPVGKPDLCDVESTPFGGKSTYFDHGSVEKPDFSAGKFVVSAENLDASSGKPAVSLGNVCEFSLGPAESVKRIERRNSYSETIPKLKSSKRKIDAKKSKPYGRKSLKLETKSANLELVTKELGSGSDFFHKLTKLESSPVKAEPILEDIGLVANKFANSKPDSESSSQKVRGRGRPMKKKKVSVGTGSADKNKALDIPVKTSRRIRPRLRVSPLKVQHLGVEAESNLREEKLALDFNEEHWKEEKINFGVDKENEGDLENEEEMYSLRKEEEKGNNLDDRVDKTSNLGEVKKVNSGLDANVENNNFGGQIVVEKMKNLPTLSLKKLDFIPSEGSCVKVEKNGENLKKISSKSNQDSKKEKTGTKSGQNLEIDEISLKIGQVSPSGKTEKKSPIKRKSPKEKRVDVEKVITKVIQEYKNKGQKSKDDKLEEKDNKIEEFNKVEETGVRKMEEISEIGKKSRKNCGNLTESGKKSPIKVDIYSKSCENLVEDTNISAKCGKNPLENQKISRNNIKTLPTESSEFSKITDLKRKNKEKTDNKSLDLDGKSSEMNKEISASTKICQSMSEIAEMPENLSKKESDLNVSVEVSAKTFDEHNVSQNLENEQKNQKKISQFTNQQKISDNFQSHQKISQRIKNEEKIIKLGDVENVSRKFEHQKKVSEKSQENIEKIVEQPHKISEKNQESILKKDDYSEKISRKNHENIKNVENPDNISEKQEAMPEKIFKEVSRIDFEAIEESNEKDSTACAQQNSPKTKSISKPNLQSNVDAVLKIEENSQSNGDTMLKIDESSNLQSNGNTIPKIEESSNSQSHATTAEKIEESCPASNSEEGSGLKRERRHKEGGAKKKKRDKNNDKDHENGGHKRKKHHHKDKFPADEYELPCRVKIKFKPLPPRPDQSASSDVTISVKNASPGKINAKNSPSDKNLSPESATSPTFSSKNCAKSVFESSRRLSKKLADIGVSTKKPAEPTKMPAKKSADYEFSAKNPGEISAYRARSHTTSTTTAPPGYPPLPPGYTLTQPMVGNITNTTMSSPEKIQCSQVTAEIIQQNAPNQLTQSSPMSTSAVGRKRSKDGTEQQQFCVCDVCQERGGVTNTVMCDECLKSYHFNCLEPPLKKSPKKRGYSWFCEDCGK